MIPEKDPRRNQPSEEGQNNDPEVRDYQAIQPGTQTISTSDTDDANQQLTETAKDNFRETGKDPDADKRFDEIEGS